ncbi:hypothetical protein Mapa_004830 [Marchantia paleacea]|nr:hypothetical protein Mapa_004830 [Marchantia paleacea]
MASSVKGLLQLIYFVNAFLRTRKRQTFEQFHQLGSKYCNNFLICCAGYLHNATKRHAFSSFSHGQLYMFSRGVGV